MEENLFNELINQGWHVVDANLQHARFEDDQILQVSIIKYSHCNEVKFFPEFCELMRMGVLKYMYALQGDSPDQPFKYDFYRPLNPITSTGAQTIC